MTDPVRLQISRMFTEAAKSRLSSLTNLHVDIALLEHLVTDLRDMATAFNKKTVPFDDTPTSFAELMTCIASIFACSLPARLRPQPSSARAARRFIYNTAKAEVPESGLAKAIVMYKSLEPLMEASRTYATIGLEDEAASSQYAASVAQLEMVFSAAFEDVDTWVLGGSGVEVLTFSKFMEHVASLQHNFAEALLAIQRWTLATLELKLEVVLDDLQNHLAIVQVVQYLLCNEIGVILDQTATQIRHRASQPKLSVYISMDPQTPNLDAPPSSTLGIAVKEELVAQTPDSHDKTLNDAEPPKALAKNPQSCGAPWLEPYRAGVETLKGACWPFARCRRRYASVSAKPKLSRFNRS